MATAAATSPPPHPALARPRTEEMSRGLRWSLIFHATVFAIIVFKTIVFPGAPIPLVPALRVDIVGLPDVLKKDLKNIPRTPAPETEQKPEPAKPLPPPVVTPPAKTPPPKEQAEPDEMVLKPTQQQTKAREKKMKSALDRIRALEKINDEVNSNNKPSAMVVKGNKVSKGSSLSPDAKEAEENSYFDAVRDKLQDNWALPVWLARQQLSAQILVRIDASGHVSGLTFMKPSGNAQFDAAVRKTVSDSQPFPPPPTEIVDSIGSRGVLVGFPL